MTCCGGGGTSGLPRRRSTSGSPPAAAAACTRASSRMKYCSGRRSTRRGRFIGAKERGGCLRPDSARPGRCYRSVNVPGTWTLTPAGEKCCPASRRNLRKFGESPSSKLAAQTFRRHVDRRPRAARESDDEVSAGRDDARKVVEERDHVVERHEVER